MDLIADSVSDRVRRRIREDILAGRVGPGDRLRIADLSQRFGVSSIPVREALRALEGDRLVVIETHRGAVVRMLDRKIVSDLYDVRGVIEALMAGAAAARAVPADIRDLAAMAERYAAAAAVDDRRLMLLENQALHRRIGEIADNPEASRYVEQGWELVFGLRNRFGFGAQRTAAITGEHRRLIEAIGRGERVLAARIVQEHCDGAKQDLLRQMEMAGL
jgi:DNA-binding GntR family transcriptional regulator